MVGILKRGDQSVAAVASLYTAPALMRARLHRLLEA
jgi:hypothetical protein